MADDNGKLHQKPRNQLSETVSVVYFVAARMKKVNEAYITLSQTIAKFFKQINNKRARNRVILNKMRKHRREKRDKMSRNKLTENH